MAFSTGFLSVLRSLLILQRRAGQRERARNTCLADDGIAPYIFTLFSTMARIILSSRTSHPRGT